jgi:hypothetical protein
MSSSESYYNHESATPEIELESFCLFDEVKKYLLKAKKVKQDINFINCALAVLQDEYPHNDIESFSSSVASAYNPKKNVTAVIYEQTALVDGDPKQALTLEFYRGSPFGHFFDNKNEQHFEIPSVQLPSRIANAVQGATAIVDLINNSYIVIAHDPYDLEYNIDTAYEDYVTMRLWFSGADLPLDIL